MLGIKEAHIVNVALGKAHGIALTDAGLVYSFGINNKGQCGRDGLSVFSPPKPSASASISASASTSVSASASASALASALCMFEFQFIIDILFFVQLNSVCILSHY